MVARIGSNNRINSGLLRGTTSPTPQTDKLLPENTNHIESGGKQPHAAISQLGVDGLMAKSKVLGTQRSRTTARPAPQMPTQADWHRRTLENAGINPAEWNPQRGFAANRQNVERVYALYERLYRDHPEMKWAGMAKLAGGVVWGGLSQIETNGRRAVLGSLLPSGAREATQYARGELQFVENKLLEMQQAIFNDLAWQHMAYAEGGVKALEACYQRGEIGLENLNAWRDIGSGNENRIWRGNEALLKREQFDILDRHYTEMSSRPLSGRVLRNVMSYLANSPIPGGRSFYDAVPNGDIMNFPDRWQWVTSEVIGVYRNLSPEWCTALNNQPLQNLANRNFAENPFGPKPQPHPTPLPRQ